MTTATRSIRPPVSARRGFLRILWRQPLWAVPFALFFGTIDGGGLRTYLLAFKVSVVFAYCIGVALWIVKHFIVPRVFADCDDDSPERIRIGFFYAGASLAASYAAAAIVHFTMLPGILGSPRAAITSGLFTLLFTALFVGYNYAIVFYRQSVTRARAVEQMRAELAEAELRALRAQIHPHFLFNTLNTIASLIATNPAAAEETTTRLADVFRYTLRASEREHARFGDELEFLRATLDIEHTRFGGRLRTEESIEPGLESHLVPCLLLQPIVENAVHHGVSQRAEGGVVRIAARREHDRLVVEITDDGPGFDGRDAPRGTGFGLHSVRERLRAAGLEDALTIHSEPGRGTRVIVRLPILPAPAISPSKGVPS